MILLWFYVSLKRQRAENSWYSHPYHSILYSDCRPWIVHPTLYWLIYPCSPINLLWKHNSYRYTGLIWICVDINLLNEFQVDNIENLSESWGFVSFGIVLFVWEILPMFTFIIFFRVKRQTNAVVRFYHFSVFLSLSVSMCLSFFLVYWLPPSTCWWLWNSLSLCYNE